MKDCAFELGGQLLRLEIGDRSRFQLSSQFFTIKWAL